jgi:hypothetical protein
MATKIWQPQAPSIAQVSTGSIDSVDATPANNTFTVTIGTASISVVGDTDVATTATALRAALNATDHPAFAAITWSGSTGNITGTADDSGMPFTAVLTETGAGTGAVTDFADTTANSSPYDAGDAQNWSSGTLPISTDSIVIGDTAIGLLYGLEDLSAVALVDVHILHSFTGAIGLDPSVLATNEAATTFATSGGVAAEYRPTHWKIDADRIVIGDRDGVTASAGGASRISIDNTAAGASLLQVASTRAVSGVVLPTIRYTAASSAAEVQVDYAPAGVGIACQAGDTSTVGTVCLNDTGSSSYVVIGEGTTITTYKQLGGIAQLSAAATVTGVTVDGGELDISGKDFTITTLTLNGGTVRDSHEVVTGNEWTTIALNGGSLDLRGNRRSRSYATLTVTGGSASADFSMVTGGTYTAPAGNITITAS